MYDIEVYRAELLYVQDGGQTECVSLERTVFDERLETIPDRLGLTEDGEGRTALETRPEPAVDDEPDRVNLDDESRCGSCPFGKSNGGPCQFG